MQVATLEIKCSSCVKKSSSPGWSLNNEKKHNLLHFMSYYYIFANNHGK